MLAQDDEFRVVITRTNQFAVVAVHGHIDLASVPQLDMALTAASTGTPVIVDLADVQYIDSVGLAVLGRHRHALERAGSSLRIRNPSPVVRILLRITGMLEGDPSSG